jgi:hypothetical protein
MAQPTYSPLAAFNSGVAAHDRQQERIRRMGLSERQLELNRCWAYYCMTQYDSRTVSWDGRKMLSDLERESIARTAVLPPGFVDPTGVFDEMPLSLRAPKAPYHLVHVVVNRFTGLLFSAKKHPAVRISGDHKLQAWVENLVKAARLWVRFSHARCLGGGMGSVALTFRFKNGRPVVEVHDTRWCTPTFSDQTQGEITALEIRYMYAREERDPKGILQQVWYWYRRVIDEQSDVVFEAAKVGDGDEPFWKPQTTVMHGVGEFPGVWIRNTQTHDVDGEPDCQGEFEAQEAMDQLLSQVDQGALENADPTLEIDSDELKVADIRKGSRNALKLEKGASAKYLEMAGSGVDSALKVADVHRRNFLEVVQCILDSEKAEGDQTATEIERRYSSMHERGDLFREQYGESGVKPFISKIIRAVGRMRTAPATFDPATGLRLVPQVLVPTAAPGMTATDPMSEIHGLAEFSDDALELVWPPWIERGAKDAQAAAGAVATARSAGAIDQESAVQYLAPYFGIDNPAESLARLKSEGAQGDDAMMGGLGAAGAGAFGGPPAHKQLGPPDGHAQPPGAAPPHPPPAPHPPAPPRGPVP